MILPKADVPLPTPPSEWHLFQKLFPSPLLNALDPKAPQAAYTPWVVTWLLVFQRLHGNATLNDAVGEFVLRFPEQALPDCKRAREKILSANTGAYSAARSSLDRRVLYWAAEHVYDSLIDTYPPSWRGRRAFLVDGSTIQLASTLGLCFAFPPASNQYGTSHWPILHLVVAHELASGLAVFPEFGPMYGPEAIGEIALAKGLLPRLPERSLLVADRNFGIFAFAHAAAEEKHDVLLRLTQKRFNALRKKARRGGEGKWALSWRPSRWDRQANPSLAEGAQVTGWLHEVRVSDRLTLWLFTTLEGTGAEMAGLYHQRLDVETDIRDLKETLELGQLWGKSVGMVEKELAAAMVAYNLANQVRRLAAARLGVQPRRLSFAGVWSLVKAFVAGLLVGKAPAEAEAEFARLLRAAGQRKLPRRAKGRSYPREVIPRRRKSEQRKRPKVAASL
jgi:Transposase DDE domain